MALAKKQNKVRKPGTSAVLAEVTTTYLPLIRFLAQTTNTSTLQRLYKINNAVRLLGGYNYVLLAGTLSLTFNDFDSMSAEWPVEISWLLS